MLLTIGLSQQWRSGVEAERKDAEETKREQIDLFCRNPYFSEGMCSCRLVEPISTSKSPVRLEDFYPLLEMDGSADERDLEDDDIYGQLEQKEKDLVLAAELGKALLEKNEELTRIHEQTVEEYNTRIEVI